MSCEKEEEKKEEEREKERERETKRNDLKKNGCYQWWGCV